MQAAVRQIDGQGQVIAGDMNPQALSAAVADGFWLMPPTRDDALPALLAGLKERQICAVLPTRDGELDFWARHAEQLQSVGVHVIVAPVPALALCVDKLAFGQFGAKHQLPFIATALTPDGLGPGPYVVKERYGAGSRSLGLNLGRGEALAHAQQLEAPIFQPMVTGREISVDGWLDHQGRAKGVVLRWRDRVINGESEVTTTFSHPAIEAQCITILQALGLTGPVVLQAMVDAQDQLHVIECNARFGGASTTGIAAGLQSLHWSLLQARGEDLSAWPFVRTPGQLRQIRMPADTIVAV
jgi:carbamoyl-phosphate synthase large subunit